jgi:TonB family protein
MNCLSCNTENRPNAQFCSSCGLPLVKEIPCRACRNVNPATANYCDSCGVSLSQSKSSSPNHKVGLFGARTILFFTGTLLLIGFVFYVFVFNSKTQNSIRSASDELALISQNPSTEPQTVLSPAAQPSESTTASDAVVPSAAITPSEIRDQAIIEAEAKAAAAAASAAAKNAAQLQGQISQSIQAVRLKVNRSWIRPMTAQSGLKCRVRVRSSPNGDVTEAQVIQSSGEPLFDTSVHNAILKASPLPVPEDQELFTKNFSNFTFTFDPDRGSY